MYLFKNFQIQKCDSCYQKPISLDKFQKVSMKFLIPILSELSEYFARAVRKLMGSRTTLMRATFLRGTHVRNGRMKPSRTL